MTDESLEKTVKVEIPMEYKDLSEVFSNAYNLIWIKQGGWMENFF